MSAKPYDVIVFGATSFVGLLLCRYLASQFNPGTLKWAAAGRSIEKLEQMRRSLNIKLGAEIPLIVADARDENSLAAMCTQTRVVVSTVGPYTLYGEPLVKICVEHGVDYCDLTGEVQWIRRMLDRYETTASKTGARIVHCCGFDSVPSDLGVHFLQKRAFERLGRYCSHVKMRVKAMRGGVSGGTIASILNTATEATENPALRRALQDPYLLCPPDQPKTRQASLIRPQYDRDFDAWLAPFIMAGTNICVVHRTNALSNYAYGEDFRYDEAMLTGEGLRGRMRAYAIAGALGGFIAMIAMAPTRWLLQRFILPAPGQGPSPRSQADGFFDLRFLGIFDDGRTIAAKVTGDADPGYGSTSKMLGQVAAALSDGKVNKTGGFWTPATLFGDTLIDALEQNAGLSFTLIDAGKRA
jgi:short subunit dehydrogenase-like uncharacterized protein